LLVEHAASLHALLFGWIVRDFDHDDPDAGQTFERGNDLGLHEKMLMEKSDVNHIDYCAIVSYFKPRFTGLKGLP
jgi:hypothetical protein